MEGYSSLFTAGFIKKDAPRTPTKAAAPASATVHSRIAKSSTDSSMLMPPFIITTAAPPSPLRHKLTRKRKSSLTLGTNPLAGLKSPSRNARSSILSPVNENRRMFDFLGGGSLGSAMNLLRSKKTRKLGPQKPIPTAPLPEVPTIQGSAPGTPRRRRGRGSTNPPSSPTVPERSHSIFSKPIFGTMKKATDSMRLRIKTGDSITRAPLQPSTFPNASPQYLSPPSNDGMPVFSTFSTPTTPTLGYFDHAMDDLEEETEDCFDQGDVVMA